MTGDLTPLCRHDHMAKTEGGWQLRQPAPGRFVWTSPLGREYPVAPEPILAPRIDPVPRDPDPTFDDPAPGRPAPDGPTGGVVSGGGLSIGDTGLDEPADLDDHPLALPTQGRAPPPHEPHTDHRATPPRGARPVPRAPSPWSAPYQPPAAEHDPDDPPPF